MTKSGVARHTAIFHEASTPRAAAPWSASWRRPLRPIPPHTYGEVPARSGIPPRSLGPSRPSW